MYHTQRLQWERENAKWNLLEDSVSRVTCAYTGNFWALKGISNRISVLKNELSKIDGALAAIPRDRKSISNSKVHRKKIVRAPGHIAHTVLSFLFYRKHYETHFAQAIADMREEVFECDKNGQMYRRRYIVFVSHVGIILSVALFVSTHLGKKSLQIWKNFGG